jgi:AcrR family transcriptional regulator
MPNESRSPDAAGEADAGETAMTRQYKSGDERREEIVRATLAILAEEGLHAWTTSTLADRVGVSEATLFKHFDSKDAILSAALQHQAEELRGRIEGYRPEGSAWERVTGLAREVLSYLEETEGGPLVILLGQAARIRPAMREEVERTGGLFRGRLVQFLTGGEGVPARRAEVLADLVVATVQSSCLRWSVRGQEGSLTKQAEPLLSYLEQTHSSMEEGA